MVEVLNPDFDSAEGKGWVVDSPHPAAIRSEIILSALRETGIKQVVEVASGWSTHGLHLCKNDPDFKYVEVLYKNEELGIDEGEEKRKVLAHMSDKMGGMPNNYHTISGDVLDEKTIEQAMALLDQKQTAVVNVALMIYFSPEQKMQYAMNVKKILQEFGGKWITPDLMVLNDNPRFKARRSEQTGEVYPFESQEEIDSLLNKTGLQGSYISNVDVKQKLSKVNPHYQENAARFSRCAIVDINKGGKE